MMDVWIILTGILASGTCALLGCFLVLRKMAMVGDAIAHAVLPGIVVTFLLSGQMEGWLLTLGAAATGLLTTYLIELFNRRGGMQKDASIGVTFTALFALGVILIAAFADSVHLDQDCVLFGEIAYVGLEELSGWIPGIQAPPTVWSLLFVFLAVLGLVIWGYKGLKLTTFDPAFAAAMGVAVGVWHYALMGAVSLTTVVTFESVGAVLVVALLVIPAATAYLLTKRLPYMLSLAVVSGIVGAVGGYYLAVFWNTSIAAAMVTVLGAEFMLAFLFHAWKRPLFPNRQQANADDQQHGQ